MPEPRRLEPSAASDAASDRLGQAEALLVDGLDCYFAGRYEDAIHIWTRVLFLDRSHARARAYIDRARTAVAERLRQSDEMVQASHDLLERGHTDAARTLLTEAVAHTGDDEQASAVRLKLERLERARAGTAPVTRTADAVPVAAPARPRSRRLVVTMASLGLVMLLSGVAGPSVWTWLRTSPSSDVPARRGPAVVPVLSSSDVALVRARTLYGRGRLAEALQALDRINPDSAVRTEADTLRIEIQRLLLASGQEHPRQPQEVDHR